MPSVLTSSQTIYLANIDGATDPVTSQSSERIDFYCDHERADTNIFAYNKFLCDNIRLDGVTIVSPDTDFAVIFLYESVTNLKFLDTIWFKTGTGDSQRHIQLYMSLASCNACNVRM